MNRGRRSWSNGIFFLIIFLAGIADADDLRLLRSLVIQQDIQPRNGTTIDRVGNSSAAYDRDLFRAPLGPDGRRQWRAMDLVSVAPGGLENPDAGGYRLALADELQCVYQTGTFAFSGPGRALIYMNRMGWGSENNNGDFIPMLIWNGYQQKVVPTYDFFWSKRARKGNGNDERIYLDYQFQVPKESQIQWGSAELGVQRQSFAGSMMSNNLPPVRANAVCRWGQDGFFRTFHADLRQPATIMKWKLPASYKPTGFAFDSASGVLVIANADRQVAAYEAETGRALWMQPGNDPVCCVNGKVLFPETDYTKIRIADLKTGKPLGGGLLPLSLPRDFNSFATFSDNRGTAYVLLNVPEQTTVLCYRLDSANGK